MADERGFDVGSRGQRMGPTLRRVLGWGAGLCLSMAIVGLPIYVFPGDDPVPDGAVAMVLGPPTWQRIEKAQALLDSGHVTQVLVSVSPSGRQSAALYPPCKYPHFTCESPVPFTTKGETAMLRDFLGVDATDRQVVVITFTPHVARTRYILQKCFGPTANVVGVSQDLNIIDWAYQYLYQTTAFVKAAVTPCPD